MSHTQDAFYYQMYLFYNMMAVWAVASQTHACLVTIWLINGNGQRCRRVPRRGRTYWVPTKRDKMWNHPRTCGHTVHPCLSTPPYTSHLRMHLSWALRYSAFTYWVKRPRTAVGRLGNVDAHDSHILLRSTLNSPTVQLLLQLVRIYFFTLSLTCFG